MRVDVKSLRLQAWRAEELYAEFIAYAKSLGCSVLHDEIMSNEEQAQKLANWWKEHT